ncbi:polyprenyl synthetase family protein [Legionella israelensis]|nr:polyprenyl synthetase family protein [Legionella israelensis]
MNISMINTYLEKHESFLEQIIEESIIPAPRIREAIHYALFPGGKRIRPTLVYLCGELLKVNVECLHIIAAAVELTHCYSLIHDDLPSMDNDDLRRGKPSCHRAFDEATAILAGDGMQALAVELLLTRLPEHLSSNTVIAITRELVSSSGVSGMVSGQSLDLTELMHSDVSEKQLCQIHTLKTGYLIASCINMVLLTQNKLIKEKSDGLKHFARLLGLVFQMQDDYLDQFAARDALGKGRASDMANRKITFASLYSQAQLFSQINEYYRQAQEALSPFAEEASALHMLLEQLKKRTEPDTQPHHSTL